MPPKPHRSDKKKQRDEDRRRNREEAGTWAPASPQQLQSEATAAGFRQWHQWWRCSAWWRTCRCSRVARWCLAWWCLAWWCPGCLHRPLQHLPHKPRLHLRHHHIQHRERKPRHRALHHLHSHPRQWALFQRPSRRRVSHQHQRLPRQRALLQRDPPSVATAPPAATAKAPWMAAAPPTRPKESSSAAAPPSRSKASSSAAAPANDSDGSEDSEDEVVQPAKKQKVIQSKAMPVKKKGCPEFEWNTIYDVKFGKPMMELKPWLIVGGRPNLAAIPQKLQRKIAIINCQNREECDTHRQECERMGIPFLAMNPNFHRPVEKWAALFRNLQGIVQNSCKRIVVVCNGGRHRSAAVACALLVLSDGLSVEAAEEYIFQRRPWAEPWETRWFVEWCEQNKG